MSGSRKTRNAETVNIDASRASIQRKAAISKRQYLKLKALGLDYYHKHHERAKEKQAEYRRVHREEINRRQWARRFLARLLLAAQTKLIEYKPRKDN